MLLHRNLQHKITQIAQQKAFTLAEVLITLGIIGIIAAMTLPALLNKAEKIILKNQFKKSYSTLSQALTKSEVEYGATPDCYYAIVENSSTSSFDYKDSSGGSSVECSAFHKIFMKNLNVIAKCENNAYPNCIPKYQGVDTMVIENNPDLSKDEALEKVDGLRGFDQQKILYQNPAFVLSDGSILISYATWFEIPRIFAIDINGKKGPNKWGYDVFDLWTGKTKKGNLIFVGRNSNALVEKGGINTNQMIKNMYNLK